MSGSGAPAINVPPAKGRRVVVIASSWHERIMGGLIEGAVDALTHAEAQWDLVRVPGSFELPVAAAAAIRGGAEAVVALGVVIRGGTPHFEYVCQGVTSGLMDVSVATGCPVGFGVLTVDTVDQALQRAGLTDAGGGRASSEDKGYEAAASALATLAVLDELDAADR